MNRFLLLYDISMTESTHSFLSMHAECLTLITMPNQKITIPLSEEDLQDLQWGCTFDWTFPTESWEFIDVHLRPEEQEDIS